MVVGGKHELNCFFFGRRQIAMKLAGCGAKSAKEATFVTVKLELDVKKILTNKHFLILQIEC